MKFTELIQEILLGFAIAIMLPNIVYWGVETYYSTYTKNIATQSYEQNIELKDEEKNQLNQNKKIFFFCSYFITAILSIFIGSFIKVSGLSVGLIGGGVLNITASFIHSPNIPIINFVLFTILFLSLVLIIIRRN